MRKCSKPDGNKNWVGKRIAELRQERGMITERSCDSTSKMRP